jgi:polar amino acid transport system permease protein
VTTYEWSFEVVWQQWPALRAGLLTTISITMVSMGLALVLGGAMAVAAEFGTRWLRALVAVYVEFFRGLPLLVLVFWIFFALPLLSGKSLSPFASGLVALTLNVAAFVAEAFRAGVASVGAGQREAGFALGMRTLHVIRRVVWPQAWRRTLPVVASIWVGLFKDSALVSLIQVHDLMFEGRVVANRSFRYLEVYTAVALIYFVVAYPQARLLDRLFDRLRTVE